MPKLAVLGHPVSHSRSPAMQTAALEAMGLAGDWEYGAIDVEPEGFATLVGSLEARGYAGANVTVPHKSAALALADTAGEAARAIGAANTLSFSGGRVHAENTDAEGLILALGDHEVEIAGRRALILGAGGSARACAWALREAGAEVRLHNRTRERAERVASELGVGVLDTPGTGPLDLESVDLLVNTTTIGLEAPGSERAEPPADPTNARRDLKALRVDADALGEGTAVVDLVYGRRPTALIAAANERGVRTIDGLEVLIAQGAASLRLWTKAEPPREVMARAARRG